MMGSRITAFISAVCVCGGGVKGAVPALGPPSHCSPFALFPSCTGCVPLDPQLSQSLEEGGDFIQEFSKSLACPALTSIAQHILARASTCSS